MDRCIVTCASMLHSRSQRTAPAAAPARERAIAMRHGSLAAARRRRATLAHGQRSPSHDAPQEVTDMPSAPHGSRSSIAILVVLFSLVACLVHAAETLTPRPHCRVLFAAWRRDRCGGTCGERCTATYPRASVQLHVS